MTFFEKRKHPRLRHPQNVKLNFATGESMYVQAQDFSEIGLYLIYENGVVPELHSQIKIQVQGIPDAPILVAKVIRVEQGKGFAVEFVL